MAFPMTSQIGGRSTCVQCGQQRSLGQLLTPPEGINPAEEIWMCDDCQRKLSRRVDDKGALGG